LPQRTAPSALLSKHHLSRARRADRADDKAPR
jgi:hypothetical protein